MPPAARNHPPPPPQGASMPPQVAYLPSHGAYRHLHGASLPLQGASLPLQGAYLPSQGASLSPAWSLPATASSLPARCMKPTFSRREPPCMCMEPSFPLHGGYLDTARSLHLNRGGHRCLPFPGMPAERRRRSIHQPGVGATPERLPREPSHPRPTTLKGWHPPALPAPPCIQPLSGLPPSWGTPLPG